MMEQLNMFAAMGIGPSPLEYLCQNIREDYFDYVEERKEWLKDGGNVPRLLTMEEYAEGLFASHYGYFGFGVPYDSFQFYPGRVEIHEQGNDKTWTFTKAQVIREI